MKCLSCDKILSDKEATRKYLTSGKFIDLCDGCFEPIANDVPTMPGTDDGEFEQLE